MKNKCGFICITKCPVCRGSDRTLANDGIASIRKDSGKHYLVPVANRIGISLNELLKKIQVYQCLNCHTFYCDPWLNVEAATLIFTEESPDHIAGWANFEHWLSSSRLNAVEALNYSLYKNLIKKIGPISRYAEYGCPFQGFLLLFRRFELRPKQRVNLFSSAIHRHADTRLAIGARLHNAAQGLAHKLVIIYHNLRLFKGRNLTHISYPEDVPAIRQLLLRGSTKAWGNNCVRYSASCSFYASKLLESDVLPFDGGRVDFDKYSESTLDLVGIFNILDHTDDPLSVISTSLKFAKHLIIVSHKAEAAGKQHLFAFHKTFSAWLQFAITDAHVTDLTNEIEEMGHHGYNCILVSRSQIS